MAIKISDIPSEGLTVEIDQKLDLFGKGIASTDTQGVLSVKPRGREVFHIKGYAQATPMLECSRCLKSFSYPIHAELDFELAPVGSLKDATEHELVSGELETEFFEGDELDPQEIIREQLLIALPMVPLHHPDCKGLCSMCGTDLNEATCECRNDSSPGAFSALKDLFKK